MEMFFRFIVARRWWVVAFYALLVPPSAYLALRVQQDDSLDRLIVQSDPDYLRAKEFEKVFGAGEYVILLAEAPDPFAPDVLSRIDALERSLQAIPGVETHSAVSTFRKARGPLDGTAEQAAAFQRFATGTELFRRQGLIGDGFLGIPVVLRAANAKERAGLLAALDRVTGALEAHPAPLTALRKIGSAYVNAYLEHETHAFEGRR